MTRNKLKASDRQLKIEAAKHHGIELNLEIGFVENEKADEVELIEISLVPNKGLTSQD